MKYTTIDRIPNGAIQEYIPAHSIIEITLWEAYLRRYHVIGRFLADQALGKSAILKDNLVGDRITYRYTADTWRDSIKPFLSENRVPVTVTVSSDLMITVG